MMNQLTRTANPIQVRRKANSPRWIFRCVLCSPDERLHGPGGLSLFNYASAALAADAGRYHLDSSLARNCG